MLKESLEKLKSFIKELQCSSVKTKKRWLIGTTAILMLILLVLWVVYLSFSLPRVVEPDEAESAKNVEIDSFFKVFTRGIRVIYGDIKSGVSEIGSSFQDLWSKIIGGFKKTREIQLEIPSL